MATDPKLQILRDRIDALDVQLIALLRQRADIIEEVRGVKGKLPIYIRPGREADMLRVLLAAPRGHLPKGLVHRLWREMIGAFTLQEGNMRVAVAVPEGEDGLWDIARDHFGSFTPMDVFASAEGAAHSVIAGAHQVASLPYPDEKDKAPWWRALLAPENKAHIFYCLPFDGLKGNARPMQHDAVLLAALQPEATGNDRTILLMEWRKPEENHVKTVISDLPFPCMRHLMAKTAESAFSWIEMDGFRLMEGAAFDAWRAKHKEAILHDRIIGAYPVPITS